MVNHRVLLLNPPGDKTYLRDYFCSKVSKAVKYCYPPTDLLVLSGKIAGYYPIQVIDAIASRLSFDSCKNQIESLDFDTVIFLTSSPSWVSDFSFLAEIARKKKATWIGIGDILMDQKYRLQFLKEQHWLDAVLMNFITDDIIHFLEGKRDDIKNMSYKENGTIKEGDITVEQGEFSYPVPRHELFPIRYYRSPLASRHPLTVTITNYGCPFDCSFCILNNIGYRLRNTDNIIEELNYIQKLGIREVLFKDGTFSASRQAVVNLCQKMLAQVIKLSWVCWTRIDRVDKELLTLMKKAGCHSIFFGVESGNEEVLKQNKTGYTKEKIRSAFADCKQLKIKVMGTFILGFPGETEETIQQTIDFAKELDCDYASFHIATPRMGTEFRQVVLDNKLASEEESVLDSSFSAVIETETLSREGLLALQKRANRQFYLRPHYIIKKILGVRSLHDLDVLCSEGLHMLRKILAKRNNRNKVL